MSSASCQVHIVNYVMELKLFEMNGIMVKKAQGKQSFVEFFKSAT
jgi:hypothetical protein